MSTRPPRPSKFHNWCRESGQWLTRKQVEQQRDALLHEKAPEFVDIEPVEGPHLAAAGHVKSVALWEVKRSMGITHMCEVDDVLDADHPLVKYNDSFRARLFSKAGYVAAEAVRQGLPERTVYVWSLLADGVGDRTVLEQGWEDCNYDFTRYEIRKLSNQFWGIVTEHLQDELDGGTR
jgi:hypothetical protein